MGYHQMKAGRKSTKAGSKDENYVFAFNWARDMEYTVSQSKALARYVSNAMAADKDLSLSDAIYKYFE